MPNGTEQAVDRTGKADYDFLKKWFKEHVQHVDQAYAPEQKRCRQEGRR